MIAIDLDNTIICYDRAFSAAAARLDCLPETAPINKSTIKATAIAAGGNTLWTCLQGIAYGKEITAAELFPGCADFIAAAREDLVIVSHKTKFPAIGHPTDLREAARTFLATTPLADLPLLFLDSRIAKVAKIADLQPRALIDDLPEVMTTDGFPATTVFHLFDPGDSHPCWTVSPRVRSWLEASETLIA